MIEVKDRPPLYEVICDRFPVRGKAVLFAWGDTLYNPFDGVITPQLWAHERYHGQRQQMYCRDRRDIEDWWMRYLDSREFRLEEEALAHAAEYVEFCRLNTDRNARSTALYRITMRLAMPMYDFGIPTAQARDLVKAAISRIDKTDVPPASHDVTAEHHDGRPRTTDRQGVDPLLAALQAAHR